VTVYLAINLAALYVTAGALVGLPLGYALGWACDPNNLPRMVLAVLRDLWDIEGQLRYLTQYAMAMENAR
jgi:hypothetical protein